MGDPGCNFLHSVDDLQPRSGHHEKRISHRRSGGRGDGAGGLCGGGACGRIAGIGEYDTRNLNASTQVTITSAPSTPSSNTPTISWSAPAAIAYGTALSSTQLNATATGPGTLFTPRLPAPCSKPERRRFLLSLHRPTRYLFFCDSYRATYREPGHTRDHLGYAGSHYGGNRPSVQPNWMPAQMCPAASYITPLWATFLRPAPNN